MFIMARLLLSFFLFFTSTFCLASCIEVDSNNVHHLRSLQLERLYLNETTLQDSFSLLSNQISVLNEKVANLEIQNTLLNCKVSSLQGSLRNCLEVLNNNCSSVTGEKGSGVYVIYLNNRFLEVYCDMETQGGGWTYVARGTGEGANTDEKFGQVSVDPQAASQWHLSAADVNALKTKTYLETYITMPSSCIDTSFSSGYSSCSSEVGYYRVREERGNFTFALRMPNYNAFDGSGYSVPSVDVCSSTDRGPCWQVESANVCCQVDETTHNFVSCGPADIGLEGQWSNGNLNQHLRCHAQTITQNGLTLFVR
eukprot:GCRY01000947.1.p1 GENE.GCRY01000947.1~~GCRY01000947.1.p1  ORF type:complete len:311 (+),score=22.84 GCRY01000947.1:430-1362(+)